MTKLTSQEIMDAILMDSENAQTRSLISGSVLSVITILVVSKKFGSYKNWLKYAYSKKGILPSMVVALLVSILTYTIAYAPTIAKAMKEKERNMLLQEVKNDESEEK